MRGPTLEARFVSGDMHRKERVRRAQLVSDMYGGVMVISGKGNVEAREARVSSDMSRKGSRWCHCDFEKGNRIVGYGTRKAREACALQCDGLVNQ